MFCKQQAHGSTRLLVLSSTYPRWATDHEPRFIHELNRRLQKEFEIHVLAPHAPGSSILEKLEGVTIERFRYGPEKTETLVNDGGIIINLRNYRWKWLLVPPFFLSQIYTTYRTIRRFNPHVIHAHWIIPQGLVAAILSRRFNTPFLLTSHGADLFALKGPLISKLKRWVCAQATCITVVSEAMVSEIIRMGIPEDRVTVQPMGVDLKSRFTPDMRVKRDPNHLLFVGRLVEKKGTHHLLKALPYVLEKHPKVKLTIAGFGPEERALRTMASDLGLNDRVSFVGPVNQEHLPNLYRKAGLLVAPFTVAKSGDQEGLGLVSIEALGCNCPVLAGDVDAVRDILPYECLRTDPRNPQTLAKDISKILSYSKEDLKEVYKPLFQRTRARFDWTEVTARYARILDAIKK